MRLSVNVEGGKGFMSMLSGTGGKYAWQGAISLPTKIVPTVAEAIAPAQSPSIDQAVARAIRVDVSTWNGNTGPTPERNLAVYFDRSKSPELRGIAVDVVVDLLHDGKPMRTVRFQDVINDGYGRVPLKRGVEQIDEFHTRALSPNEVGHWTLRLRGERAAALAEFDCDRFWSGKIDYPLKDVLTR